MKTSTSALVSLALLAAVGAAQDVQQPQPHPKQQRLIKALQKMAALSSVAFATAEHRDLAALRNQGPFGGGWVMNVGDGPSADGVSGVRADGLLYGRMGVDEWILAGGRSIARSERDPTWRLRHRRLADGSVAPRLVDPQAFVLALLDSGLEVTGSEVGSRDDRPVERITATLSGDAVAELMWAGLLPTNGSVELLMLGGGRGAPAPPKPKAVLDLCFEIDPATGIVHEIRTASYADTGAGAFAAGVAAAPGVAVVLEDVTEVAVEEPQQEEVVEEPILQEREVREEPVGEEPVVEEPTPPQPAPGVPAAEQPPAEQPAGEVRAARPARAAAQLEVRLAGPGARPAARPQRPDAGSPEPQDPMRGLPVRDKDGKDVVTFSIRFADHGKATLPALDERARRLLSR